MKAMTYSEKLEETERKINEYFEYCDRINEAALSETKKIQKPYTVSGLLYHLGLSRAEYEKMTCKKSFAQIFAHAMSKIEVFIEENALAGTISASAASNTLKYNFGWNDRNNDKSEGAVSGVLKLVLDGELMKLAE